MGVWAATPRVDVRVVGCEGGAARASLAIEEVLDEWWKPEESAEEPEAGWYMMVQGRRHEVEMEVGDITVHGSTNDRFVFVSHFLQISLFRDSDD
jgi:hypothetical protein